MKIKLFTIPNLLTLSNLMCGSLAVVEALVYGNLQLAFWLIVAGAVFDFFDGFAARLLKSSSEIGVQLDSLADMISFGLAPASIAYILWGRVLPGDAAAWIYYTGILVCFAMAAFSALRLAKFNIDQEQHTEFRGLPTPANALFFASLGWISEAVYFVYTPYALLLAVVFMSWLMITDVRMFALKFQGFGRKGNELRYGFILFAAALLLAAGVWASPIFAVPVIIVVYIFISLLRPMICTGCCDVNNQNE